MKRFILSMLILSSPLHPFGTQLLKASDATAVASATHRRYKALETLSTSLYLLEKMYIDAEDSKISRTVNLAIKGVVEQLDPHTI